MTLGTFDYISPEQARDPRDVNDGGRAPLALAPPERPPGNSSLEMNPSELR
jgi:hypothetical protein